ncbi:MAG TPA: DUF4402 domain-containing protein [Pedobacter sp.]|jgi:hypothetical protein
MNTFTKGLSVLALSIIGLSTESFAQTGVNTTATASATIVTPISILKTTDLNFGNVAVNATAGTVLLDAIGGTPTTTPTGGVTLPTAAGNARTAAAFTVSGQPSYTYAITLPGSPTTLTGASGGQMTVNLWTSLPSATGTIGGGGTQTLYVGATLNVTGGQTSGLYTGAPFTVSVNYN